MKRNKINLKGFAIGALLGLLLMLGTSYAFVTLQTKSIQNTVIGASPNLTLSPTNLDWQTMKLGETKNLTVQVNNTGNDNAYVYWIAEPQNDLNGDGNARYLIEAYQNGTYWQWWYDYRILLEEGTSLSVTFKLTRLQGSTARLDFRIDFVAVA